MKKCISLCLLLAVVACAGDKSADESKSDAAPKVKSEDLTKDLICPQVAILQAGEEVFDFGGEKPDPSQLVAKARMKTVKGDCGYRKKDIDIAFTVHMKAQRGSRLGGAQVSFPYFVAVIDPSETIISRQVLTATFVFSGSDKTADDDEALHIVLPMTPSGLLSGPSYRVLVGFQEPKLVP